MGLEKYLGKGYHGCATCDGAFYRGKNVIVVGGGDTAFEDALFLAKFASKVYLMHRNDRFKSSKIMQKRVEENAKIEIQPFTEVIGLKGDEQISNIQLPISNNGTTAEPPPKRDKRGTAGTDQIADDANSLKFKVEGTGRDLSVQYAVIKNNQSGEEKEMPIDAVFAAIGRVPSSDFLPSEIHRDDNGYIKQVEGTMTTMEGVFVAGDVADPRYRQAIVAAGDGAKAAIDAEGWLENN
jgi:thioredoxin reductase (NADPH)